MRQLEVGSVEVLKIMAGISRRPIWITWQNIKQCSEDFPGERGLPRLPWGSKKMKEVDFTVMVLVNSTESSPQQKLKDRDRVGGTADCVQGLSGRPVPSS